MAHDEELKRDRKTKNKIALTSSMYATPKNAWYVTLRQELLIKPNNVYHLQPAFIQTVDEDELDKRWHPQDFGVDENAWTQRCQWT